MKMSSRQFRVQSHGFALPTILIASIVMMIVLLGAVSTVSSVRNSLAEQYYMRLANEAAESAYARVMVCLKDNANTVTWSDANPLRPNTNCDGTTTFPCPVGSTNSDCYVLMGSRTTTTFSIGSATIEDGKMRFSGGGTVTLSRSNDMTSIVKTYQSDLRASVSTGARDAQYVSSGYLGVCAIFDEQTWCWGDNKYGQLGLGYTKEERTTRPSKVLRLPGGLQGKRDKIVTTGTETNCVVTIDDEIYCWGRNDQGQTGTGSTGGNDQGAGTTTSVYNVPARVNKPAQMQGLEVKDLVIGFRHVCALTGTDVWCWGSGGYGQLGENGVSIRTSPVRVWHIGTSNNAARPVTSLASGPWSDTNCAIVAGESWCWGRNDRGQMGDGQPSTPGGSYTNRTTPWRTPTSGASSLAGKTLTKIVLSGGFGAASSDNARRGHACALDTSKRVHCWGSDQYGQTGRGFIPADPWVSPGPRQVNLGLVNGKDIADVAVGFGTTCLLTEANELYCWGYNDRGQVGDGTMGAGNEYRPNAMAVVMQSPGLLGKTITSITAGANRTCALSEGRQYCWGVNSSAGQLGDGTMLDRPYPVEAVMLRQLVPLVYF